MSDPIQFRNNAVYLSKSAHRALRLVSKAMELNCADQLAEQIVNEWLMANHPEVCQFVENHENSWTKFQKDLHTNLKPKRPLE